LWLPGASHAGGTQSSNPLCSRGESCANLTFLDQGSLGSIQARRCGLAHEGPVPIGCCPVVGGRLLFKWRCRIVRCPSEYSLSSTFSYVASQL
jgi:hypothetical protein